LNKETKNEIFCYVIDLANYDEEAKMEAARYKLVGNNSGVGTVHGKNFWSVTIRFLSFLLM